MPSPKRTPQDAIISRLDLIDANTKAVRGMLGKLSPEEFLLLQTALKERDKAKQPQTAKTTPLKHSSAKTSLLKLISNADESLVRMVHGILKNISKIGKDTNQQNTSAPK